MHLDLDCKRGFTLIELMLALAVIGILSWIAIPAYQQYSMKAKFSEVYRVSEPFKVWASICSSASDCVPISRLDNATGSGSLEINTVSLYVSYPSQSIPTLPDQTGIGTSVYLSSTLGIGTACQQLINQNYQGDTSNITTSSGANAFRCNLSSFSLPSFPQNFLPNNQGVSFEMYLSRQGSSSGGISASWTGDFRLNVGCAKNSNGVGESCDTYDGSKPLKFRFYGQNSVGIQTGRSVVSASDSDAKASSIFKWITVKNSTSTCYRWNGMALC